VKRPDVKLQDMVILKRLLLEAVPGPRIEFGVLGGKRLKLIAEHDGETFGVDSFEGMAAPTQWDYEPGQRKSQYPAGRLARPMDLAAKAVPGATLIKGFVPEILPEVPDGPYAFAHLDMDQYSPTLGALFWLFNGRFLPGGIVLCHDWFKGRTFLAGGAINEFAAAVMPCTGTEASCAWWVV
jgi:hypothetical protein